VRDGKPVCEFCFAGDIGLELHCHHNHDPTYCAGVS
jgi:hypothetical protein